MKELTTRELAHGGKVRLTLANGTVANGRWDKKTRRFIIEVADTQPQPMRPGPAKPDSFMKMVKEQERQREEMRRQRERQEQLQQMGIVPQITNQTDSTFKARIREVLLDNKYKRRTFAQKRGKLDSRRLSQASTTDKVFYHTKSRQAKDYAITLLVDCSGSMNDRHRRGDDKGRIEHAREAAALLQSILKDISLFTMIRYGDSAKIVKEVHQLEDGGGTNETEAIQLAYKEFDKTESKDKIMIVLTDGAPNNEAEVEKLINNRKHDITSIAVCIQSHQLTNKTETLHVEDITQIKSTLVKVLKKHTQINY